MRTMARSISITQWPSCWRNCCRFRPATGIEFTKSRANRSTDNALVEGKNGAVIRKLIGHGHIAGEHAELVQKFYTAHLNPYLNYHRPCGFATVSLDARGKRKRQYRLADYATPYEKLKSLPEGAQYFKENITFAQLDKWARGMPVAARWERYRSGEEDGGRENQVVAPVQKRVTGSTALRMRGKPGCGNDGRWKAWKPKAGFPPFPPPLEISHTTRDSHISTASTVSSWAPKPGEKTGGVGFHAGGGKVEIQKQDSHFSTACRLACGARKKTI